MLSRLCKQTVLQPSRWQATATLCRYNFSPVKKPNNTEASNEQQQQQSKAPENEKIAEYISPVKKFVMLRPEQLPPGPALLADDKRLVLFARFSGVVAVLGTIAAGYFMFYLYHLSDEELRIPKQQRNALIFLQGILAISLLCLSVMISRRMVYRLWINNPTEPLQQHTFTAEVTNLIPLQKHANEYFFTRQNITRLQTMDAESPSWPKLLVSVRVHVFKMKDRILPDMGMPSVRTLAISCKSAEELELLKQVLQKI